MAAERGARQRQAAASGGVRKRRRRVIEESESDSGEDEREQGAGEGLGASVQARLTAGRLARAAEAGGPGDERHQAAVAEARRHLGGGGKRGWLA